MFTEQCKRRGIKLEDLDKGWVPQHKIGEDTEDEIIEDEDFEDEDEDIDDEDEEILFKSRPAPPRMDVAKNDSESNSEILFKTGKQKTDEVNNVSNEPIKVDKPEVSMADLEAMFGASTNQSSSENDLTGSISPTYGGTPNRDRITIALKKANVNGSDVNVMYDKTTTDPGMAAATINQSEKPKIKLNIKQKPPM